MSFAKNMGGIDRALRLVVGIALIAFAVMGPADIGWKWIGYIGIVPVLTALVGNCPAYSIFGIRTCKAETA